MTAATRSNHLAGAWAVAALGFSSAITQLTLLRELLCVFHGNELVLGVVLGNWLLLTGAGAWLGRFAVRGPRPAATVFWGQLLVAVLPPASVLAVRLLQNTVLLRGATVGVGATFLGSLVVLLPFCMVSGFFLTLACAILDQQGHGNTAEEANPQAQEAVNGPTGQTPNPVGKSWGLGSVYMADSVGSVFGGLLFTFILVGLLDHLRLLYLPALLNFLAAAWVARQFALGVRCLLVAGLVALTSLLLWWPGLELLSTAWQHPGQEIVFSGNSPYGRLLVTRTQSQLNFLENGQTLAVTHNVEQAEETVHYAMAQRPAARRVLLISGAITGALEEVLKYNVDRLTVVELDPLIVAVARRYLPGAFDDPRITVVQRDGRAFLRRTQDRFDVVILGVPDPATSQLNRFYTAEFFAEAKRALAPDGVLALAVGRYENFVSNELARVLATTWRTLRQAFANVLTVPGGRVFFLGSDGPLSIDIATRLEERHVGTRFVRRSYLDAMLTPDRLADLRRALERPAALNTDFRPALYYLHLLHWLSQFNVRFSLVIGVALAALGLLLAALPAVPRVLLASGFAASSLELVLLLALQILFGSVYQQMGVVVSVFMGGLAAGAWWAMRLRRGSGSRRLRRLALGIAALGVSLPVLLPNLGGLENALIVAGSAGTATARVLVWTLLGGLTLALAFLVGAQFPVAGQLEAGQAGGAAARLYAADFLGAGAGALLASSVLIPLLGVTITCLLVAALNLLAGLLLGRAKDR